MIARKGFMRVAVWPQVRALPPELALDIADRVYVLDQGAVVYQTAASEPLADDEIKEPHCSV
jgi:ABC-type branched-subunit amino acid transport system ATPase component